MCLYPIYLLYRQSAFNLNMFQSIIRWQNKLQNKKEREYFKAHNKSQTIEKIRERDWGKRGQEESPSEFLCGSRSQLIKGIMGNKSLAHLPSSKLLRNSSHDRLSI